MNVIRIAAATLAIGVGVVVMLPLAPEIRLGVLVVGVACGFLLGMWDGDRQASCSCCRLVRCVCRDTFGDAPGEPGDMTPEPPSR